MQTKNKFGVLGYGYVGRATHFGILNNQPIVIHDRILGTSLLNLKEADTVFVCVPTSDYNDIEVLINEVKELKNQNAECQIVVRSTLPPGTCSRIEKECNTDLIYIPEFLRERHWDIDCQRRPLIVGINKSEVPDWLTAEEKVLCSLEEAEIIKMFSNNYATVRIAFANLFYDLSQKYAANYDTVKSSFFKVVHDQTYMEVPGHDGTRGFGGKCLPKDLDFMIDCLENNGIDNTWLQNIRELNKEWQKKF